MPVVEDSIGFDENVKCAWAMECFGTSMADLFEEAELDDLRIDGID
jgi:hypothetical protein